jgi:hypothetical protein
MKLELKFIDFFFKNDPLDIKADTYPIKAYTFLFEVFFS